MAKTIFWGAALVASGTFLHKQLHPPHRKCSQHISNLIEGIFSDLMLDLKTFDPHIYTLKLAALKVVVENLKLHEHLEHRLFEWIDVDYRLLIQSEGLFKLESKELYEIQELLRQTSRSSSLGFYKTETELLRTQIRDIHDHSQSLFEARLAGIEYILRNLKVLDIYQDLNGLVDEEYQRLLIQERVQLIERSGRPSDRSNF